MWRTIELISILTGLAMLLFLVWLAFQFEPQIVLITIDIWIVCVFFYLGV